MIAIDTNLLVYAQRRHSPEHRTARKAIERASTDPRGVGNSLALHRRILVCGHSSGKHRGPIAIQRSTRFSSGFGWEWRGEHLDSRCRDSGSV